MITWNYKYQLLKHLRWFRVADVLIVNELDERTKTIIVRVSGVMGYWLIHDCVIIIAVNNHILPVDLFLIISTLQTDDITKKS